MQSAFHFALDRMTIDLLNTDEVTTLRSLISSSHKAVTICHINADGDALGSSLTWAEYLRQQGVETTVIVPDQYPDFLTWMPGNQTVVRYDKHREEAKRLIDEADLVCILDLNTLSRTGAELQQVLEKAAVHDTITDGTSPVVDGPTAQPSLAEHTIAHTSSPEGMARAVACNKGFVLIDHHLNPDIKADVSVSFPEMSSTAEIVFRLIWQLDGYEAMTHNMAVTTYVGMMTDTGGFTFNSTRPEIFFIISQLLAKGIDKDRIYRNVFHVFSVDRLRMTGYVLYQKLKVLTPLRASYYTITKEEQKRFHFIKGDAEGLVNMPLQIKGHRLSISLREDTEKPIVWVSLRSVDDFPCNKMAAEFFNGGGHKNASGGRLYCSMQEAEQVTRMAIKAYAELL